jgi:4-carboxymuconolactone decarboxylase
VGEYLRFHSVLDDDLVELVILFVARHWDQDFEYGFHRPLALKAGLPPEVVDAVANCCLESREKAATVEAVLVFMRQKDIWFGASLYHDSNVDSNQGLEQLACRSSCCNVDL